MYRAFQGANGWYVAFERRDGSHHQPAGGGNMTETEARLVARARNTPDNEATFRADYDLDLAKDEEPEG